jgi:hypothetical protein
MKKSGSHKPRLALCVNATKSLAAGQLLYRVFYWMPKATVTHGGVLWVANSAAQWCRQTGLTHDQYRRAIARLRLLDLVETSQHLFGRKNITHVRLTQKASNIIANGPPELGDHASPGPSETAPPDQCEDAQLNIQGEFNTESQNEKTNIAIADAHAAGHMNESNKNTGKKNELAYGKARSITEYADSTLGWEAIWHDVIGEVRQVYVPPFNGKERKLLKNFCLACPPNQSRQILDACLRHWSRIVSRAKETYDAFHVPTDPTLEFLLKFKTAAINVGLDVLANPQKYEKPNMKFAVYVSPFVKEPVPEFEKVSDEELHAILSDDPIIPPSGD